MRDAVDRTRRWYRVADGAGLTDGDVVRPTVFAEMSALATRTGAINLGQGFPDSDPPAHLAEAAVAAIRAGHNQYPPGPGVPALREAVAAHQRDRYGLDVAPDDVLVTAGATEAITAAVLAFAGPGDEVLTIEPWYDSYAAATAMAGATHTTVPLVRDGDRFRLDPGAVRDAVTPRTRVVVLNTPHNPTGTVLGPDDLAVLAGALPDDAVVVTDDVYEHLVYDGVRHVPAATLPGLAGRTLTVSSAGKTLSVTGWKIGWLHGPAHLVEAVQAVKQYLTYVSGGPFQHAVAAALGDERTDAWVAGLRTSLERRRDLLCEGLEAAGFDVVVPSGTYFVVADAAGLGFDDGDALCRRLPELAGVVAVPVSAFCRPGSPAAHELRSSVRFTFVKQDAVLHEAVERLGALRRA